MRTEGFAKDIVLFVLVVLVFLASQLLIFSQEQMIWDEAVYIGIAKFLGSGGAAGMYEPIRPLVLPLLIAPWWFLGLDLIMAGKLVALAFSISALVAMYRIGSSFGNRSIGLVSMAMLAFTPVFFFSAQDIMTEIPSIACVLFALIMAMRKRPIWAGILAGTAATLKFPHLLGLLILIAWIPGSAQKFKTVLGSLLPLGSYLLANLLLTGSALGPIVRASRHGANIAYHPEGFFNNLFYYLVEPVKDNPLLLMGLVGLFIVWFSRKRMQFPLRFLMLQASAYLIYFIWIPNKQLRFFLLFIPVVCILSAMGLDALSKRIKCPSYVSFMVIVVAGLSLVWTSQAYYAEADDTRLQAIEALASIASPILTTDPLLSAYTHHRYIPFYFFIYDEKNATAVFNEQKDKAQAVVWWPQSFACEKYPGLGCEEMLSEVEQELDSSWTLVLETQVNGGPYRVYVHSTSS